MLKMKSKHVGSTITKKKKSKVSLLHLHLHLHSSFLKPNTHTYIHTYTDFKFNICSNLATDVVVEVCRDLPAWPGRHLFEDGEQRRYFGLKTQVRGVVEFECKNQKEYDIWTQGVARLLSIVSERKTKHGSK